MKYKIKEAIEMLNKYIYNHKVYNIKHSDGLEDCIKTVLNSIERLQREKVKANKQISKLQKEKKRLESAKDMYDKHKHIYQKQWLDEREINSEKDKIINLMKEYFVGLTVWDKEKDEPLILGDKKEVEEFFKKLANETN